MSRNMTERMGNFLHRVRAIVATLLFGALLFGQAGPARAQVVQAPLLMTCSVTLSTTVDREQIANLPISGRDVSQLIFTCPGPAPAGAKVGLRSGSSNMILDGSRLYGDPPGSAVASVSPAAVADAPSPAAAIGNGW